MAVKLFCFLLIFGFSLANSNLELPDQVIDENTMEGIEHRYVSLMHDLGETMQWLEIMVKNCLAYQIKNFPNKSKEQYQEYCVGKMNAVVHQTYLRKMKVLRRAFISLIIKRLDPFRVKYEDEILYLVYLLNFFITKDFKIGQGLESALKTSQYQVHKRKFEILLSIIDEHMREFFEAQNKIKETRNSIILYFDTQMEHMKNRNIEKAREILNIDINKSELS